MRRKKLLQRTKYFVLTLLLALFASSCTTWKLGKSGQRKVAEKTYVIVGASSGFGRGVAEELGRINANVVIAARRTELLEEVAQNIRTAGGSATVVTMDTSNPEDLDRVRQEAVNAYGSIDVWINMAGVGAVGRFWEVPQEDMARLLEVNLTGFIYGSQTAVRQFIQQGHGVLINVGSVDSETPHAYQAAYSASKAGIRSFTLALAQELRLNDHDDIEVVVIEPWAADTPFWRHAANYTGVEQKFLAMDEPNKVVNAILRKSLRPSKVVPVGWKARGSSFFANVLPRFNEWLTGNIAHKYQMEKPPKAENSEGALYEPMEEGRGVEDGVDERMDEWDDD